MESRGSGGRLGRQGFSELIRGIYSEIGQCRAEFWEAAGYGREVGEGSWFLVLGSWFRVSSFEFRVSSFEFRVPSSEFRRGAAQSRHGEHFRFRTWVTLLWTYAVFGLVVFGAKGSPLRMPRRSLASRGGAERAGSGAASATDAKCPSRAWRVLDAHFGCLLAGPWFS